MVVTERAAASKARRSATTWRGGAFGLALEGETAIPNVGARDGSEPGRIWIEHVAASTLDRSWPDGAAEVLVDRRFPDGTAMLRIERHSQAGYRIWAPGYGRYVVSPAGDAIRVALPRRTWRWQRLFFAQVLPLAAALQGLEPFHASAVVLDGHGVALVASSGTGKTSVAAHLVARGASLLTDDVLALEPTSTAVVAHPGPRLMNLAETELAAVEAGRRRRLGPLLGRSEKLHLAAPTLERSVRLRLVYFLRRGPRADACRIAEAPAAAQLLLAAGFLTYVRSRERLLTHLDACARISELSRVFRIDVPPSVAASGVADAIAAHAAGLSLGGSDQ